MINNLIYMIHLWFKPRIITEENPKDKIAGDATALTLYLFCWKKFFLKKF